MGLTTAGRDVFAAAIIGATATLFNSANARIGVGDGGGTPFANTQTDLAGTNKLRKAMDATYPTVTGNTLTFRSTFTTSEAVWSWAEWGVFNAAAAGTMLNRKVEALGTKPNDQSWQITATLTVIAA